MHVIFQDILMHNNRPNTIKYKLSSSHTYVIVAMKQLSNSKEHTQGQRKGYPEPIKQKIYGLQRVRKKSLVLTIMIADTSIIQISFAIIQFK